MFIWLTWNVFSLMDTSESLWASTKLSKHDSQEWGKVKRRCHQTFASNFFLLVVLQLMTMRSTGTIRPPHPLSSNDIEGTSHRPSEKASGNYPPRDKISTKLRRKLANLSQTSTGYTSSLTTDHSLATLPRTTLTRPPVTPKVTPTHHPRVTVNPYNHDDNEYYVPHLGSPKRRPTNRGPQTGSYLSPQLARLTHTLRMNSPGSSMFDGSPCKTLTSTLSSPSYSPSFTRYQNATEMMDMNSLMIVTPDGAKFHDPGVSYEQHVYCEIPAVSGASNFGQTSSDLSSNEYYPLFDRSRAESDRPSSSRSIRHQSHV